MNVLGISCHYHDAAAAIVTDGAVIAAAEEERFSRRKHDSGFPQHAVQFCLETAGIRAQDLDYVAFYEKPLLKMERILLTTLATWPRSSGVFRESMIQWFNEKLWIKSRLMDELGLPADRILFVEHHASHAASAFFCSPYQEAAIVTVDGVGEWTTTTIGRGSADWSGTGTNRIELLEELRFPHSLGLIYSAFTAYLGFEVNDGEYKVMGMAPYGEPRYFDKVERIARLHDDGSLDVDLRFFEFQRSTHRSFGRRFVELFGPARTAEMEFTVDPHTGKATGESRRFADIAASIQLYTEQAMLRLVARARDRTGLDAVCIAGGVAMNSVANGRVMRESAFRDVYIQPAAGDGGGAVGAALYAYHVILGGRRSYVMEHAYLGRQFTDGEAADALRAAGVSFRTFDCDERLVEYVVNRMLAGGVVGWHQGRFEWGARALGNRSIVADPRSAKTKDTVNRMIKFREPFRPFAPAVPESSVAQLFDVGATSNDAFPLRFMLSVLPWKPEAGERAPAVNHNGTGRVQTVRPEWNPRYAALIDTFGSATGVPVLLNTSFNLRGEPIVNTPMEALSTFQRSGLDTLVIGPHIVEKS